MKKIISVLISLILALLSIQIVFADGNGSMSNFAKVKAYASGQFTDVAEEAWYAENVKLIYELGLISGTSESTFEPDSELTFAEIVALSSRIHSIYAGNNHDFGSSTPWYQTYYDYNTENRIIPFEIEPDSKVTRAEFAWVLVSTLPADEFEVINDIPTGAIPDVDNDDFAVYPLYKAGILFGSDEYGTFNQADTIKRSEAAAIITRVVDKSLRKEFTLKVNILREVEKINSYISQGLYLEAINLCNDVVKNDTLSMENIQLIKELSETAQSGYKDYINALNIEKYKSLLTEENKNYMYEKCKENIKSKLNYPSTVKFNSVIYSAEPDGISVVVKYEAANAFGVYSNGIGIYLFNERLYMKVKY